MSIILKLCKSANSPEYQNNTFWLGFPFKLIKMQPKWNEFFSNWKYSHFKFDYKFFFMALRRMLQKIPVRYSWFTFHLPKISFQVKVFSLRSKFVHSFARTWAQLYYIQSVNIYIRRMQKLFLCPRNSYVYTSQSRKVENFKVILSVYFLHRL